MFVKNRIVKYIVYAALSIIALYTGISCVLTACKACSQPYLLCGNIKSTFMGYYMLAAVNGIICIAAIAIILLIHLKQNRAKKTE